MTIRERLYTVDEFNEYAAALPNALLELIDGRIVEKMTTEEHGAIAGNIIAELRAWKRQHSIKGYYSVEPSVEIADDDKNHRRPDVAFRLTDGDIQTQGALDGVPDFCVEVRSPSNTPRLLRAKAEFYIAQRARLVWLVHPPRKVVEVYFADGSIDIFTEENVLSGGEVLPGFEMRVADIFEV